MFGEDLTQGLDDTTIAAGAKYPNKFTNQGSIFCKSTL